MQESALLHNDSGSQNQWSCYPLPRLVEVNIIYDHVDDEATLFIILAWGRAPYLRVEIPGWRGIVEYVIVDPVMRIVGTKVKFFIL